MFSIQQFKDTDVLAEEVIEVNTVNMWKNKVYMIHIPNQCC